VKLTLYQYWRSSSAWRVRFALHYKELAFEIRSVNLLRGEQHAPEYRRISPLGFVPCLVVEGRPLTESMAILEYLEEVGGGRPLLPGDSWQRARARQLASMIVAGIQPLQNLVVLDRISEDQQERVAWIRHFNERGLEAVEGVLLDAARELGTPRFCLGDELTVADVCLVPQVATARRYGVAIDRYPRIIEIERACLELPAAQSALPERQPDAPAAG
jgi:maleylacetoacetate isomerase